MHARCCPACSKRYAELVSPSCPVCSGTGVVVLGAAALSLYEPAVVARSVALAVEAEAREIEAGTTLSDDRAGMLRSKISLLVNSGLIKEPKNPRKKSRHLYAVPDLPAEPATPSAVAAEFATVDVAPLDEALIDAAPYEYRVGERPNVRGLPSLSAAGHPSSTARISDAMPVGTDTGAIARQRGEQGRAALVLVKAAPIAVGIKERRAARDADAA